MQRTFVRKDIACLLVLLGTTLAPAAVAQSPGALLELLRHKVESATRESVARDHRTPSPKNPRAPSEARDDETAVLPTAADAGNDAATTASADDPALAPQDTAATTTKVAAGPLGPGTRALFAEIESIYLEKSDDNGKLPSMAIDEMAIAIRLAGVLPGEYRVSLVCVQLRDRRGQPAATSQGIAIASQMKGILAEAASPRTGRTSATTRWRREELRRPTGGCPQDFPMINGFLDDFAEAAKRIVAHKKTTVAERRAREREQAEQAHAAAERDRAARVAQEEAKEREEIQRAKIQRAADEERAALLRAGKEKPASFRDFVLLHKPELGQHLFTTPSLTPGAKIYQVTGVVKRQEDDGILIQMGRGLVHVDTKGSRIFSEVRLNRPMSVVGIHTSNAQYATAFGGRATVASIDAIAIEGQ